MSRTKRNLPKNNFFFRPVNGKKQKNSEIEKLRELSLDKGKKIQPYSADDVKLSAWKEKVKIDYVVEKDGSNTYTLHGRFLVNLTPEEEKHLDFQHFFGEYAEHLA